MAKGCIKYDIQEYVHPIGWESRIEAPFRLRSDEDAMLVYEVFKRDWKGGNLRLAKIVVLEQDNFTLTRQLEEA